MSISSLFNIFTVIMEGMIYHLGKLIQCIMSDFIILINEECSTSQYLCCTALLLFWYCALATLPVIAVPTNATKVSEGRAHQRWTPQ